MAYSYKMFAISLYLLGSVNGCLSILCYSCNTRDHAGCDDLRYRRNSTWMKLCNGTCAAIKAQWGNENPYERKYMLWRGCGPIDECTQSHALCCQCKEDYCNYGNICFSRGKVGLPGIIIICSTLFSLVYNKCFKGYSLSYEGLSNKYQY